MIKDKPSGGSWSTFLTYALGKGATGFIIAFDLDGTKRFYHYDRLGNVMNRSDASGEVSDTYDQDAFGNVLAGSSGGFHLTTKNHLAGIGLYYFYQRWYDPTLGRFTQKDLIDSANRYVYCDNNPMNCFDPMGLLATWEPWPNPWPKPEWPLIPPEPDIPWPCEEEDDDGCLIDIGFGDGEEDTCKRSCRVGFLGCLCLALLEPTPGGEAACAIAYNGCLLLCKGLNWIF